MTKQEYTDVQALFVVQNARISVFRDVDPGNSSVIGSDEYKHVLQCLRDWEQVLSDRVNASIKNKEV